jgi:hypothetical protein
MKNRKINFIKLGIFLFGISILLWNCEKEDSQSHTEQVVVPEYSVSRIGIPKIQENIALIKNLDALLQQENKLHSKNVYSSEYDFTVNTDFAKYIENRDGTYHSYTFPVSREIDNGLLENLLVTLQNDGSYKILLISYDVTEDQKNELLIGNVIDLEGKVTFTKINNNLLNLFSRTETISCFEIYTAECSCGVPSHPGGISNNGTSCQCQSFSMLRLCGFSGSPTNSGNDSGNDSDNENNDNHNNAAGSGGPASNNDNDNNDEDEETIITVPTIEVEDCIGEKILNTRTGNCECPDGKVEDSAGNCVDDCTDFEDVVGKVLNIEGGFVDDPTDPGGPTNKGISWPVWKKNANNILGLNPTLINLQNLTENQAKKIYKKLYWDSIYADDIIDGDLRYMLFDFHVNAGGNAIKVLQKTLNQLGSTLTVDGGIGSQTINEINVFDNQITLYNTFKSNRKSYYNNITQNSINKYITKHPNALEAEIKSKTFKKYINGWINRANHFLDKTSTNYLYVNC